MSRRSKSTADDIFDTLKLASVGRSFVGTVLLVCVSGCVTVVRLPDDSTITREEARQGIERWTKTRAGEMVRDLKSVTTVNGRIVSEPKSTGRNGESLVSVSDTSWDTLEWEHSLSYKPGSRRYFQTVGVESHNFRDINHIDLNFSPAACIIGVGMAWILNPTVESYEGTIVMKNGKHYYFCYKDAQQAKACHDDRWFDIFPLYFFYPDKPYHEAVTFLRYFEFMRTH